MTLRRRLVWFASFLAGLLLAAPVLRAQGAVDGARSTPIESRLNPDGSLKLDDGFTGTLDPRGWDMVTASDGSPRFVRSSSGKERSGLLSAPGDEGWDLRFGGAGVNGPVLTVAVTATDVYIGGHFSIAGGTPANNVARWDVQARTWNTLGRIDANGVGGGMWAGRGSVYAICVVGNNVYIGGSFEHAGDKFIEGVARWERSTNDWFPLSSGVSTHLEPSGTSRGGDVHAIIARGNDIIIAGRFFKAGSEAVGNVARWDGTRFYGVGPAADSTNGTIYALAYYGNDLYIGGEFDSIGQKAMRYLAKYSASSNQWQSVPGTLDSFVYALAVSENLLYAGGSFRTAGGVPVNRIASFNGTTWSALGPIPGAPAATDIVRSIVTTSDGIVVGGRFSKMGGLIANGIARWSKAAWTTFGVGMAGDQETVYALGAINAKIYAGGSFTSVGSIAARNIALWDSTDWKILSSFDDPGFNRNGANRGVYAVALRGADVFIGGDFTMAGGLKANRVAQWNSQTNTWSTLGSGIGGPAPFVRALAFRGNDLYVGGIFTTAGGGEANGIARWDGTNWSPVGGGVGGPNPFVFAMTTVGNDLYVAGAFTTAGGAPANRIAKWDGNTWSTLGEGISSDGYAYITAIATSGSNVYVGGDFTRAGSAAAGRVAKWDGSSWSALGAGVNAQVSAIGAGPKGVYVGGDFTTAGGAGIRYFALWNGTAWVASDTVDAPVRSINVGSTGDLIIGGEFTQVNSVSARSLAMYTGTSWKPFGAGESNGVNGPVRAIALNTQYIYTGGEFSIAGGTRANNVVQWDGIAFSALGSDPATGLSGPVLAIAIHDTDVYAGGDFAGAGGLRTSGIARWNGHAWSRVGGGFDGAVRALTMAPNGNLYAAGEFKSAEGKTVNGVALWNGSTWEGVGGGVGGSFPIVNAMVLSGDNLFIGGRFSTAGGQVAHRIARWSLSTRTWLPVGDGIGGSSDFTYVMGLAARNDTLYAVGSFPSAGGVPATNIARWDGTRWSGVGVGTNSTVYAVAIGPAGEVYVGGDFTMVGELEAGNIAVWDGASWQNLGEGLPGKVYTIVPGPGGMIYVGGLLTGGGIYESGGIVRWDGQRWLGLGTGVARDTNTGYVAAIGLTGSDVYVGGDFTMAGGRGSLYFGRWSTILSAVPNVNVPAARPLGARLAQNHPNPVHDATTFSFRLASSGFTTLKVYDMAGVEMATVAAGAMTAGEHSITWEPADLPSGVYCYRLEQGGAADTRTLVIWR